MKIKEIPCATILKLSNDLIKIEYKHDYRVELEDAKMVDDVFLEFAEGAKVYGVMDTQGKQSLFSKEAQKFLANEAPLIKNGQMLGFAMIINNLPNRMMAKFFITFFKPKHPVKIVASEEQALLWITLMRRIAKKKDMSQEVKS